MNGGSEWTVVSSGKSKSKGKAGPSANRKQSNKQWQLDGAMALAGSDSSAVDANVVNESEVVHIVDLVDKYRQGFDGQPIGDTMKLTFRQFLQSRSLANPENEAAASMVSFSQIIALGIGSIARSANAQLQFGLLLFLRDLCHKETSTCDGNVAVTCFDPSMTATDVEICRRVGIAVMTDNTKGFLSLTTQHGECTLVYMPHCPYRLYCNVLWSLWPQLSTVCLVGNSFQSYALRRGFPGNVHLDTTAGDHATPNNKKKKKHHQQQRHRQSSSLTAQEAGDGVTDTGTDVTDSVALLTPFLHEVLLPCTLHNSQDGHFALHSPLVETSRSASNKSSSSSILPSHLLEAAFCELR